MKQIVSLTLLFLFSVLPSLGSDATDEVGHKPTLKGRDIEASFEKLKPLVAKLAADSKFTLFEGLPHQTWDREQLEEELKAKATVKRFGFPFYKTPNEVEAEDAEKLKALVQDPKSFIKFRGHKLCGGFHPDFSLVWGDGEEAIEIHICFGCHEIKAYGKDVEIYCDISGDAFDELEKLLQKYRKQRPKQK
jgi:hypothetical protein